MSFINFESYRYFLHRVVRFFGSISFISFWALDMKLRAMAMKRASCLNFDYTDLSDGHDFTNEEQVGKDWFSI